jgi:hypothetical protein
LIVFLDGIQGPNRRTESAQISDTGLYRTVSAQPHNPAQLFLPIVAPGCKITLDFREKGLYTH